MSKWRFVTVFLGRAMKRYKLSKVNYDSIKHNIQIHFGRKNNSEDIFSLYSYIHMYIHCLGRFSPLTPAPTLSLLPTLLPGRTCSALSSNIVEENISNNKKDKAFLLVEIRVAIQRDS
jgi:hypothetical protein